MSHGRQLPLEVWSLVQASVPILCVDVVPIRFTTTKALNIGLILRDTPLQGPRWCVIGGRLLLDELIADAARRESGSAIGDSLAPSEGPDIDPIIVEYSRKKSETQPQDPRQHAVSITVPIWMQGEGAARGDEAREFRWWDPDRLDGHVMGFGQERLVPRILRAVDDALRRGAAAQPS